MGVYVRREWLSRPGLEAGPRLRRLAKPHGVTVTQLSLTGVLRGPNVAAAIVGAT